jgi:hypothetical protein
VRIICLLWFWKFFMNCLIWSWWMWTKINRNRAPTSGPKQTHKRTNKQTNWQKKLNKHANKRTKGLKRTDKHKHWQKKQRYKRTNERMNRWLNEPLNLNNLTTPTSPKEDWKTERSQKSYLRTYRRYKFASHDLTTK